MILNGVLYPLNTESQYTVNVNTELGRDGYGIKYDEGKLHYSFKIVDDVDAKEYASQLRTYPFFENSKYYIFIYVHFESDNGLKHPLKRENKDYYLVYRYKLERQQNNCCNYSMSVDNISIGVKPKPKLK